MHLVDTHCHLTDPALYCRLPGYHAEARQAQVRQLITVATNATDSRRTVAVADHYEGVYATVGIHPHEAGRVAGQDWLVLRELRHNPTIKAWGEIGLDYHYDFSPKAEQQRVFVRQLELAGRTDLPLVIHCREAVSDVVAALEAQGYAGRRVVFHCFTGTASEARTIRDRGWRMSFTGIVTFKNSRELQAIARDYPLEELLLETDAPYLSPLPHRKVKPNHPALLVHTALFLANLKGVPLEDLAAATTRNAQSFFDLPATQLEVARRQSPVAS